jgi:hypothetical protein
MTSEELNVIIQAYGIKQTDALSQSFHAKLAPSNRPVQVAENPALFWREIYPKLKQQF